MYILHSHTWNWNPIQCGTRFFWPCVKLVPSLCYWIDSFKRQTPDRQVSRPPQARILSAQGHCYHPFVHHTFPISIFQCKTKFCLFFVVLFVVCSVCFVSVAVVGLSTFLFTTSSKRIVLRFLCHHVDHPIFHTFSFTFLDLSFEANDILGDL